MPHTGRGRRWPSGRGCPGPRSGGSGRPSSSSRTGWMGSSSPRIRFVEKVYDVVGLYLDPPESAVVLCVDGKSQVQALARTSPVLPVMPAMPAMPAMPERRSHDYVRHGVTSLFAAFNIADGTVISSIHRRHRAIEFKKFLAKIDAEV